MLTGHEEALKHLDPTDLPQVILLKGPPSIGKRTAALELAKRAGVIQVDLREVRQLSRESADAIATFAATKPFGTLKLVVVRLDGATEVALNSLLKLLEEPPPSCKFILTASKRTLATIESRAHTIRMGLLTQEQVSHVLQAKLSMPAEAADVAARVSGGSIARALEVADIDTLKATTLTALKATKDNDQALLSKALKRWGIKDHELLLTWLVEALTERWCTFTVSETFALHLDKPKLHRALKLINSGAAPRLAARSALSALT